jgi:hydroxyacyl-ACP dehydratase HTD2-like protein with hotdog domain
LADDTAIDDREVEHYRTWVGRRTTAEDNISKNVIERFAAAVDRDMPADGLVPQMWHYGLFLDATPTA